MVAHCTIDLTKLWFPGSDAEKAPITSLGKYKPYTYTGFKLVLMVMTPIQENLLSS